MSARWDAVVVGSGPNGLVAAVTLARAGWSTLVLEAAGSPGGGTRTGELTLPGFRHDICSSVHPLGVASPALAALSLHRHGLRWIHPEVPLAHTVTADRSVLLHRSIDETDSELGVDGPEWRRLMRQFSCTSMDVGNGRSSDDAAALLDPLSAALLAPLMPLPRDPMRLARFAPYGLRSCAALAQRSFCGDAAALLGGLSAHSNLPLDAPLTAGLGLLLGSLAHNVGWPVAAGGSQSIADALLAELRSHGGELRCNHRVRSFDDLPSARALLFDTTPQQLVRVAGSRLPPWYRSAVRRFRPGAGVHKMDWALDGPVPWADERTHAAATVHVGGSLDEVRRSEAQVAAGRSPDQPFVLVVQPSRFDPSRAPTGMHVLWAYCHVPNGSTTDMSDRIEGRIEQFAPGFRDRIVARSTTTSEEMASYNTNYVGGDISAGATTLRQMLFRPTPTLRPWSTPTAGIYLCSASTPPGPGVHGIAGRGAADLVLSDAARGRL